MALSAADITALRRFLLAQPDAPTAAAALEILTSEFDPDVWACEDTGNRFAPAGLVNLYTRECPSTFRTWLADNGTTADQYAEEVGEFQYKGLNLTLKSLGVKRDNKGWRIRLIGFPSIQIIAAGLATHYQGTQNQNAMARASVQIRDAAMTHLEGRLAEQLAEFEPVTADHWDGRALMPEPVTMIGNLDITTYNPEAAPTPPGAQLRMVRNTTIKKELSAFLGIRGLTAGLFDAEGGELLSSLRVIAERLGDPNA